MKKLKEIVLGIFVLSLAVFLIVMLYRYESTKTNRELARRIAELSPRGGPPETIDGLRQAIALYETQIERNVREGAQTGSYWKILGIRLADRKMHNDALAAFERAIYFNGEDPVIFYLTGISAGMVAKEKIGFTVNDAKEKERYFTLSENAYKRALELDATYTKAMFGLAVLYVYELNRPEEAITQLERFLSIQTGDVSAMFVLASAYYMTKNNTKAIEMYDRIITRTKNKEIKNRALENIDLIRGQSYE
jgi:tetratricopeptide (TPR) repeat protein